MKKVLLGLSGGVDSALSAALLIEQGFDVTGVYLKAWDESVDDNLINCPWKEDIADARRVAAFLGIPFSVIDVSKAYYKKVVEVLKREYQNGRTPNPDILCNREMKFGIMLQVARELDFDFIATGHYASIARKSKNKKQKIKNMMSLRDDFKFELLRGMDKKKDQTYFLWTLTQDDLKMTLFPIGNLTKSQVRIEAKKRKLPVANKKDSQGICFLGPVDLREFLHRELYTKKGRVLNENNIVIGEHDGAALYTIGQRHGFKIHSDPGEIYFVTKKDIKNNQITVSKKIPKSKKLTAKNLNWISEMPKVNDVLEARIRHGQAPQKAIVLKSNKELIKIAFMQSVEARASGQSVVLSKNNIVLGGGIIE